MPVYRNGSNPRTPECADLSRLCPCVRQPARQGQRSHRFCPSLDNSHVERIFDEPSDFMDAQPFHQLGAMGLDGLHTHAEFVGDVLSVLALGDESQRLTLARGQRVGGVEPPVVRARVRAR